jgi:WD40 repeat protein
VVSSPFKVHTKSVWCITFSSDDKQIACGSMDKSIRVFDGETGEMVAGSNEGHTKAVLPIASLHDGKCIASGSCSGC